MSEHSQRLRRALESIWQGPIANVGHFTAWRGNADDLQSRPGRAVSLPTPAHVQRNRAAMTAHYGPPAPAYVGRQKMGPD